MKKLLLIATAAFLAASCSKGDYTRLLPSDAAMVASVAPARLAAKCETGDFSKSIFYQYAEKQLAGKSELTEEQRASLLALFANPSQSGVNTDKPVYLFGNMDARGRMRGGMLAAVADRKKIDAAFQNFPELKTETLEGVTFLAADEDWVLGYNDFALLFYAASSDGELKNEALALFNQKAEASLQADKQMFAALTQGEHDLRFVINYGPLMQIAQKSNQMQMPGFEFLKEMVLDMNVDFEAGRIATKTSVAYRTAEAKKQAKELTAFLTGTPTGALLDRMPAANLGMLGFNIKGANLYTTFEKIPVYAMLLGMAPQAKPIISALEGDVMISMQGVSKQMPEFTLLAEVSDVKVLDNIRALLPMLKAEGATGYAMPLEGLTLHIGLSEKVLYLTTSEEAYKAVQAGSSAFASSKTADLFRRAGGAAFIDVTAVRDLVARLAAEGQIETSASAVALPILGLFEDVRLSADADNATQELLINMTDKQKNAAATLYKTVEGFAQLGLMQ